jgi:hypothetical protein
MALTLNDIIAVSKPSWKKYHEKLIDDLKRDHDFEAIKRELEREEREERSRKQAHNAFSYNAFSYNVHYSTIPWWQSINTLATPEVIVDDSEDVDFNDN